MNIGFPDVCVTPPGVPTPYPNFGNNAMSLPFCPNVITCAMPTHNMAAMPPMTLGDNAGVMSPFMGPGGCIMGMPNVLTNGLPTETLLNPEQGNMFICSLDFKLVPSLVNVLVNASFRPRSTDIRRHDPYACVLRRDEWNTFFGAPLQPGHLGHDQTGHVRITTFTLWTATKLRMEITRLIACGAKRLTLDLTGCRGGSVRGAIDTASLFTPPRSALGRLHLGGHEVMILGTSAAPLAPSLPITLRVDAQTASAAEWFACALRHAAKATIHGRRTQGKGWVQAAWPSVDGQAFVTRSLGDLRQLDGSPIEGCGVEPD